MKSRRKEPTRIVLGKNVRRLRKAKGWSQEQLAEAAQLSQVSISGIERGVLATNLDVLDRLAEALETSAVLIIDAITSRS